MQLESGDFLMKCKIAKITHLNGKVRDDGRYPQRIDSIVNIISADIGSPMLLEYIKDYEGNSKEGFLQTSSISEKEFVEDVNLFIITTQNSIYYLVKEA